MINPTDADIGRTVLYTPRDRPTRWPEKPYTPESEEGAITKITNPWIFVRYRGQQPASPGKATCREDLQWLT